MGTFVSRREGTRPISARRLNSLKMAGDLILGQVYYKAQKLRALVRHEALQVLEQIDVLLGPTGAGAAELIEPERRVQSKERAKRALATGGYLGVYSFTGAPALSILCGFTTDGEGALPLAMQIAGKPFDEATVLRVAHAYEQGTPWHERRPPL